MIKKNEIIKKYKDYIKELKRHNDLYFNKDNPEISDGEFDNLKNTIKAIEKKHDFLKKLDLNKNSVGSPPSNKFEKIKHLTPMLSLSNAFNNQDMQDFLKKINNFLNIKNEKLELFAEPKIDGISAS